MSKSPLKLISPERVKTLLECYGADPANWPQDERSAALSLLNQSSDLQAQQQEAGRLDNLLRQTPQDLPLSDDDSTVLVSRIVDQLPDQAVQPESHSHRTHWSIAAAAAILLLATPVIIQMQSVQPEQPPEQLALADYELWLWEDVTGDAIAKDNETLDFMALVELEQFSQ